jgi:hypothetical protein
MVNVGKIIGRRSLINDIAISSLTLQKKKRITENKSAIFSLSFSLLCPRIY